jgi:hypothetical protein
MIHEIFEEKGRWNLVQQKMESNPYFEEVEAILTCPI